VAAPRKVDVMASEKIYRCNDERHDKPCESRGEPCSACTEECDLSKLEVIEVGS
jgi:hypothetical protein